MKKQLLTIAVVFATAIGANAQAPDLGFETWANVPGTVSNVQDPVGWASFNTLTHPLIGMPQSVFQETTAPYAGLSSVKIVTEVIPSSVSVPNPLAPGNLDTAGILVVGKVAGSNVVYGYPYANRPATLSFAWKYTPNPNNIAGVPDTAYVIANMTKWNGTSIDIVATGTFKTWLATSTYAVQTINMVYNPAFSNVMPDSEQVYISSSIIKTSGAKKGSAFYADAFQWAGYVSTGDIAEQNVQVSIYPNPASSSLNFKCNVAAEKINIIDIAGRSVGTYDLIDNKVSISTENYSSGIYFYNLLNSKKEIISRDKFEVVK